MGADLQELPTLAFEAESYTGAEASLVGQGAQEFYRFGLRRAGGINTSHHTPLLCGSRDRIHEARASLTERSLQPLQREFLK